MGIDLVKAQPTLGFSELTVSELIEAHALSEVAQAEKFKFAPQSEPFTDCSIFHSQKAK